MKRSVGRFFFYNLSYKFKHNGCNRKVFGCSFCQNKHQTKTLVFSGELGICYDPILFPPPLIPKADVIWIESNYGDRIQPLVKASEELKTAILDTFDRDGLVIIPEFSVSRTQLMMMYYLFQLMEKGQISKVLIFVDSPMATSVTKLYQDFHNDHQPSALSDEVDHNLFQHPQLHYYQKTRPILWQCYNSICQRNYNRWRSRTSLISSSAP